MRLFQQELPNLLACKMSIFFGDTLVYVFLSHTHAKSNFIFLLNFIFFLLDSYFLLPTFALFPLKQLEVELQHKLTNARILMITATKCTLTFEVRDEELMMFSDKSERCCPLKA